ncbi:hypothetical protein EVAR_20245_1 [Eumeta japonica]|uniref:Uncharacterized protein n=1 Tax=Eumeta variegata TaxID=151549 RepID=A0A4C1W852_EUMVA|nr:hypothetical protein EVAR_20245_1 [Eumeta japonica]
MSIITLSNDLRALTLLEITQLNKINQQRRLVDKYERQELHNDLENPVDDENDYCDDDLSLIEDPQLPLKVIKYLRFPFLHNSS